MTRKATVDAVHIAVAAVNRVSNLVTWNCTHIANAASRGKIEQTLIWRRQPDGSWRAAREVFTPAA